MQRGKKATLGWTKGGPQEIFKKIQKVPQPTPFWNGGGGGQGYFRDSWLAIICASWFKEIPFRESWLIFTPWIVKS